MKSQLFAGLLAFFIIFGLVFPLQERLEINRNPASVEDSSCYSLVKSFFGAKESKVSKLFNSLTGIKRDTPFDYTRFKVFKAQYLQELGTGSIDDLEFERSPEGLLALAEALNNKNHLELGPSIEQLPLRKKRALTQVARKLVNDKPIEITDLEKSISDIYSIVLGPTFKLKDAGSSGKNRIMYRIFAEDVATEGLLPVLKKYKVFKGPGTYQKILALFDSKNGKRLLTGLFNLPVIWGMPPFYLPGLKRIRIPHDIAKEAMMKGMTDDMLQKMIKAVNEDLVNGGSFKLDTQAKYRVFRRYYMYGVAAFTVYIMYEDIRLAEQYREENRVYEEALEEVSDRMNDIEILEERGFDLFEENQPSSEVDSLSDSFCRAIKDCLDSEKNDTGVVPIEGSESYMACKEFMDPDNKCKKY